MTGGAACLRAGGQERNSGRSAGPLIKGGHQALLLNLLTSLCPATLLDTRCHPKLCTQTLQV